MDKNIFKTYKFYNDEHERLSIFCKDLRNGILEIFILSCDAKSNLSKKYAKKIYDTYLPTYKIMPKIDPTIMYIPILRQKGAHGTFINYCNTHFLRLKTIQILNRSVVYTTIE